MTTTPESDVLAAALIQISGHAERLAVLDERETSHHADITDQLRDLASDVAAASQRIGDISGTLARRDAILESLDGLDTQVAELAEQVAELAAGDEDADGKPSGYQPVPAPRWWKLTGTERETALDRLRAWVDQIYRPSYGQLAAMLPPCWEQHPFCLHTLDWLSELWSFLYLTAQRDGRSLAAQAEWQTRLLPAAAEQMAYEATGCQHGPASARRPRSAGPATSANGPQQRWP